MKCKFSTKLVFIILTLTSTSVISQQSDETYRAFYTYDIKSTELLNNPTSLSNRKVSLSQRDQITVDFGKKYSYRAGRYDISLTFYRDEFDDNYSVNFVVIQRPPLNEQGSLAITLLNETYIGNISKDGQTFIDEFKALDDEYEFQLVTRFSKVEL